MEIAIGGRGSRDASCPRERGEQCPSATARRSLNKETLPRSISEGSLRPPSLCLQLAHCRFAPSPFPVPGTSLFRGTKWPPSRTPFSSSPLVADDAICHIVRDQVSNGAYLSEAYGATRFSKSLRGQRTCVPHARQRCGLSFLGPSTPVTSLSSVSILVARGRSSRPMNTHEIMRLDPARPCPAAMRHPVRIELAATSRLKV